MVKLGIDIGGTTIKGARFIDDKIAKTTSVCTNAKSGTKKIIEALFGVVDELITSEVEFIGVASAGNIDPVNGVCVYATDNLKDWTNVNIKKLIEDRYNLFCKVENDAIAALIGEISILDEKDNVTMITLGTGVGGASIVNNEVVRGVNFNGGRWGHVPLVIDGLSCNCGMVGCAEQYLSATALLNGAKKIFPNLNTCEELFNLYRNNNDNAKMILNEYAKYLNSLLYIINNSLAPKKIIIGGGVALSSDVLKKLINMDITNVVFAHLKDFSGVVGASLLVG